MVWTIEKVADGKVLLVTMNSNKANVMKPGFFKDANNCLDEIENNPDKYGRYTPMILTASTKSKAFSAGLDLATISTGVEQLSLLLRRLLGLQRRTIAAIDNHAIAGGFFLGLACDERVVKNNSSIKLGFNEVQMGLPFPIYVAALLFGKLDRSVVWKYMSTGQFFTPEQSFNNSNYIDFLLPNFTGYEFNPRSQLIDKAIERALIVPPLAIQAYLSVKNWFTKEINEDFERIKPYFASEKKRVLNSKETKQLFQEFAMRTMRKKKRSKL